MTPAVIMIHLMLGGGQTMDLEQKFETMAACEAAIEEAVSAYKEEHADATVEDAVCQEAG